MNKFLPIALLGCMAWGCAAGPLPQVAHDPGHRVATESTDPFAPRFSGHTRRAVLAPAPEWKFDIDPDNLPPRPPRMVTFVPSGVASGTAPMPFGYSMFGPWDTGEPRTIQIALPITPTRPR